MPRTARPSKLLRKARAKLGRGTQPTRELHAYHEAAHVVVAWALGVKVERVTIEEQDMAGYDVDLTGGVFRDIGTFEENAAIACAGRLADCDIEEHGIKLRFDVEEHNDDRHVKTFLLLAAGMSESRAKALLDPTIGWAEALLTTMRRQWLDLAETLCRRRRLEFGDLARILGPLPAVDATTLAARAEAKAEVTAGYPALKEVRSGSKSLPEK